jgi:hypothetical protein
MWIYCCDCLKSFTLISSLIARYRSVLHKVSHPVASRYSCALSSYVIECLFLHDVMVYPLTNRLSVSLQSRQIQEASRKT